MNVHTPPDPWTLLPRQLLLVKGLFLVKRHSIRTLSEAHSSVYERHNTPVRATKVVPASHSKHAAPCFTCFEPKAMEAAS